MSRNFGFFDISGSLTTPPKDAPIQSVTYKTAKIGVVTGSLNIRRGRVRHLYDRVITGQALRSEVGESPDGQLSGNFGIVRSPAVYANQPATPPSWTQNLIHKDHAFVIAALSSSHVEVSRLNTFLSGNLPLETGPVPASASAYYSKQQQLVYKVYKLSASIDLPVDPVILERYPSQQEWDSPRGIFDAVSGSYRNNSYWNPAIFTIDIPDYGKIRDVRVWVEFIHDVRGANGTGSLTSSAGGHSDPYYRGGLGGVQVALRSPNVTFPYSHPLWNASTAANFLKRPAPSPTSHGTFSAFPFWYTTGSAGAFGDKYQRVPELLKNSYLLWAGHSVEDDLAMALSTEGSVNGSPTPPTSTDLVPYGDTVSGTLYLLNLPTASFPNNFDPYYAEWDSDIDMRTVFWDGSSVPNPRDLSPLFSAPTNVSPGPGGSLYAFTSGTNGGPFPYSGSAASKKLWFNSPNSQAQVLITASLGTAGTGSAYNDYNPTPGGFGIPWFFDARIPIGGLQGRGTNNWLSTGVPIGWLTSGSLQPGPGEFPTSTGSSLGPNNIRGVYPILDDIYVEKKYDEPYSGLSTTGAGQIPQSPFPILPIGHAKMVGFRPGLRGTEIHGKWQLMIGSSADFDGNLGMIANQRAGIWFRQFRLEFILDVGVAPVSFIHSRTRKYKKPSYVPQRDGGRRVQIMSGSAEWDIGVNYVLVQQEPEYGRSIGITDNTGSDPSFAVFTRLTGALADFLFASASLAVSGTGHALYSYLNNENGTPFIPISSGSGIAPAFQFFNTQDLPTKSIISSIINPRPIIPQAHTLKDTVTRLGGAVKTNSALSLKLLNIRKSTLE
jgi:hypothetical protein